jgi:hypothetical protein
LEAPASGRYAFDFDVHSNASFYFDEEVLSTGYFEGRSDLTLNLVGGELYDFTFYYTQNGSPISYYYFYWQYDGQSRQVIPSQYYAAPQYVSGDVIQLQVICQLGYSKSSDSDGIDI